MKLHLPKPARLFSLFSILTLLFLHPKNNAQSTSVRPPVPGTHDFCTTCKTNPNPQNGNGTLGNYWSLTKCGLNFTAASQRLGKRFSPAGVNQPAPFVISGIPTTPCVVIEKAILYCDASGN